MRVALVVTDLEPGGTPLRLVRLARRLRATGIDVHVGCLARPGPLRRELDHEGIPTFSADAAHARDLAAVFRLRDRIRTIKPDIIHATLTHANVACRWVGRKLGIPVLSSTATIEVERPWHVRLERWTRNWDAGHIVNSQAVAEHVRRRFRVSREKIHLVPPSVEPWPDRLDREQCRRQLNLPVAGHVILWAGRFDPVKRVDLLIDCLPQLPSDSLLALAGDGVLRAEIEKHALARGLQSRVRFLGWQSDLSAAMSSVDVFAFPSRTEGMPNAVLTAMAAGVPVVASDIPPHRELAGDEKRLLLVGDSVEEWGRALGQLLGDSAQCRDIAERALSWARANLDPARTTAATIEIYKRVLVGGN